MFKDFIIGKKAAFFDLDGTVVDSLGIWEKAYASVLPYIGLETVDLSTIYEGTVASEIWKKILANNNLTNKFSVKDLVDRTDKAYLNIALGSDLYVRDGFRQLVYELRVEKKFKTALVSNSLKPTVETMVEKLSLRDFFDLVLTGDQVKKRKPDPEIYLTAAKKLGVSPKEVLVFEDSLSGAISASKAGMQMIIIGNNPTRESEYPRKKILTFLSDFESLPGNLDMTMKEYLLAIKEGKIF